MTSALIDPFGRRIEYLRLSVTDRCDLRCSYCLPPGHKDFEEPDHWLRLDEIERVVRTFTELGVRRVRLTGGEPLTRRDLPRLVGALGALPGLEDLSLSTNAVQLGRHAQPLYEAGIRRINVSLDSLRPERYAAITGGGKLAKVLAGLDAARDAGFAPIKINVVAMAGVNDDEYEDIAHYCIERGFTLRFIEAMPVGATGRGVGDHFLDLGQVREQLEKSFTLVPATMPGGGPARYVRVRGTDLRIGFITPMSQHFCETCNRVRLTAAGTLYLCLGQDDAVELRPLLRAGIGDEELKELLQDAIAHKPERHEFCEQPGKIIRFMSQTGG